MNEIEILKQAIEVQQTTIAALSEAHKKEQEAHKKDVDRLTARIKELTAQVAWLNRQLYGRTSEKLPIIDPNYPDLFAAEFGDLLKQAEEKRDEAVSQLPKEEKPTTKQKRQLRRMHQPAESHPAQRRGDWPAGCLRWLPRRHAPLCALRHEGSGGGQGL